MKNTFIQMVCAISCLLFSGGIEAQIEYIPPTLCTGTFQVSNQTSESWTVNYYGIVIIAAPLSNQTFGFTNANPNGLRSVQLTSDPTCNFTLPGSSVVWNAPCAPGTASMTYYATYPGGPGIPGSGGSPGCLTQSVIEFQ